MNQQGQLSIRFKVILNILPIIFLQVYYYTHYIEGTYSFFIPLGLTLAWLFISALSGNVRGLLFNKVSIWWMVYLLLCVTMVLIGFSKTNLNFIISRLPYYLIPSIGYYVIKYYNKKEKTLLLVSFFIVYLFNLIYNIIIGFQFPEIFEKQESTELSIEFGVMMNLADTNYIIASYLLIGVLLMTLLTIKNKLWRLLSVILIVPIVYYLLFQNTRGTAILMLATEIVGFVLAYFEPKKQKNRSGYYVVMIILLIVVLFFVFIPIMQWAIENVQSERLAVRLKDLLDFREGGGDTSQVSEGSFMARLLLARTSLNTFLANPINMLIGIGDQTISFGGDLIKTGIGGHSEFIDVLARYGLVGAIIYWNIMSNLLKFYKRLTSERKIFKYVNIIFMVIIISGFLNPLFEPILLLFMFVIFPLFIELTDIGLTNQKISYRTR